MRAIHYVPLGPPLAPSALDTTDTTDTTDQGRTLLGEKDLKFGNIFARMTAQVTYPIEWSLNHREATFCHGDPGEPRSGRCAGKAGLSRDPPGSPAVRRLKLDAGCRLSVVQLPLCGEGLPTTAVNIF
jgi:hypothetical protein